MSVTLLLKVLSMMDVNLDNVLPSSSGQPGMEQAPTTVPAPQKTTTCATTDATEVQVDVLHPEADFGLLRRWRRPQSYISGSLMFTGTACPPEGDHLLC